VRRTFRGSLLIGGVAIATVAGAAGIAADATGASAAQAVSLGYTCAFPSGSYPVGVEIAAAVKSAGGGRIGPVSLRVTTRLPRAVLTSATGVIRAAELLSVTERSPSAKPLTARWPISAVGQVPASGDVRLAASGTIPAIATRGVGLVTFSSGGLAIVLRLPNGGTVRASCTPHGGATRFASVTVQTTSASRHAKSGIPANCGRKIAANGVPTCAFVTGYSDVAKLIGAALLQPRGPGKPGLVNVAFIVNETLKPGFLFARSAGELLFRGRPELPPVTATFLAFRFVPVSATLHFTELTTIVILSKSGVSAPPFPVNVTTTTKVSLHLTNVRVNGVPLNVGARCRPESPITLRLFGEGQSLPLRGYTVQFGGPLLGEATVPPFTGCGVTENLDPLLTGSISGRGNFVRFIQGELCGPSQRSVFVCPPPVPKPTR
jgi:hypothetical protein